MPIHDWTRVPDYVFHDFHVCWVASIMKGLNQCLPSDHYATIKPTKDEADPHIDRLETCESLPQPQTRFRFTSESIFYVRRRRRIEVRRVEEERTVAVVEFAAPGVKLYRRAFDNLVKPCVDRLSSGINLLLVDILPPGRFDPRGLHDEIWSEFSENPYTWTSEEPLTLASYAAGLTPEAFVEPTAVNRPLLDMPLFLAPDWYVSVQLETAYQETWRGTPRPWREVLEA